MILPSCIHFNSCEFEHLIYTLCTEVNPTSKCDSLSCSSISCDLGHVTVVFSYFLMIPLIVIVLLVNVD